MVTLPIHGCMSQIIKNIKGHKYVYDVKWDPKEKKQVWKYKGKVGSQKNKEIDKQQLKKDLYHSIKNDAIIRISKRDLKRIRNVIDKVIEKS